MNKNLRGLWILPLVALLLSACVSVDFGNFGSVVRGSGKVASEARSVSGFDQVVLSGTGDLTIQLGDQEALTVEAEDNLLPLITTEVKGDRLEIGVKPNITIQPTQPIRYTLTVKNLTSARLNGSGSITGANFKADHFDAAIYGSGDIVLDGLRVKDLGLEIPGSGKINVKGQAETLNAKLSGSGQVLASDLQSQSARATVSGSGEINVWTVKNLDAQITGSGTVAYYGSPQVAQKISGSGSMKSLGEHK